jgi:hypothetical protein
MRLLTSLVPMVLALLGASQSQAQLLRPSTGVTLGVTGGTLGIGPEISYRINPVVALRGSATFFGLSHNDGIGDYDYRGKLRLRNYGATVDLYIPLSGARASLGARVTDDNRINFVGQARENETFGTVTLTPDQQGTLSGEIRTRSVSPIATIGYTGSSITGLTFGIDAGAMFHGSPKVRNLVATGRLASDPLVQARRMEQEQRLRDEVDGYKVYPVLQISIGYRF